MCIRDSLGPLINGHDQGVGNADGGDEQGHASDAAHDKLQDLEDICLLYTSRCV